MIAPATQHAIERALAAGDTRTAAATAERALAAGDTHPTLYSLAAWAREEAGDWDGATALLRRASARAGDAPMLAAARGRVLRRQGRLGDALRALDAALIRWPDAADLWLERAIAFDLGNSLERAAENYERVRALDPAAAAGWAGGASVAARRGEREAALALGTQALARAPGDPVAAIAVARVEVETAPDAAAARLEALLGAPQTAPADRIVAAYLLGDAYAAAGSAAAAVTAYTEANAMFAEVHTPFAATGRNDRAAIKALTAALADGPARWPLQSMPPTPGAADNHVFLLGYRRSGNTLVENILASLPGAQAIEERPTLAAGANLLDIQAGVAALERMNAHEAAPLRAAYWAKTAACGVTPDAALFVDMDPAKVTALPLIARLFPAAKVVLMRRDPRDVVWSCFKTNFVAGAQALEFTTLERAARHYDAVMRLTELCLDRLPLNVQIVRYEALVADFDVTTRALCNFIGVPWSESLRTFDKTAQRRGVSTASASQVRRGLYDGSGQWRPFADVMAPVLPLLTPWVEKFGYPD